MNHQESPYTAVQFQKRPLRVMVIDDSPTTLKIIQTALGRERCQVATGYERAGWGAAEYTDTFAKYRVIGYEDPAEALEVLLDPQDGPLPDLILLDLVFPAIDGLQVLLRCKITPSLREIPVIIVSAKTGTLDKLKAKIAGAAEYIAKPFVVMDMLQRIAEVEQRYLWKKTDLFA